MSLDPEKWLETLPTSNTKSNNEKYELDPKKWTETIVKVKKNNPIKKYSLTAILFVIGLIFVSVIKNETRILQKEIDNLYSSIYQIKFDLYQATLDHEVITSPENISKLAKIHLESDLDYYKKSQIRDIDEIKKEIMKEKTAQESNKELKNKIKIKLAKKISQKKREIKKLQELYRKPEEIPVQFKVQLAKRIEQKKTEIKTLYTNPGELITLDKIQKWGGIQIVKAFLGIPIIPGK